ncbi:MAG: hypothetical protein HOY79_39840 [Streptomyces sp.]|nr:hypothetical protein [Streptomyces sp.]
MLNVICYGFGFVLLTLAAVLPNGVPMRDRMAFAGLALWLLPTTWHTLQTH